MSIELRQLRYFAAVAEELNFTRASARLHVAQQTLSAGIAQLEASIGFKLFERTTRTVALTDAGNAWLPFAREALTAAGRAQEAGQDLAAGHAGRLRVGLAATAALDLTPKLLRAFTDRLPRVELITRHFDFGDPTGGLLERQTDVAIVRPPFAMVGLELLGVASEPRYAAMAADHPLAHRSAAVFDDLAREAWIEIESDPIWCDFWRVSERRTEPLRVGAHGRSLDDLLEAARSGRAIGLVPASVAHAQPWSGLAFVEVADIAPSEVAIAWRSDWIPAPVRDFIALASDLQRP